MKNRKIGIFGREDDPEVELLKARVEDLGAEATIIDLIGFPKVTTGLLAGFATGKAVVYDHQDLAQFDAFYLRQMSYFSPLPQTELSAEEWAEQYGRYNDYIAAEREKASFTESVIEILSEMRPMVNPYRAAFYHKLKPYQYCVLASRGLPVPDFRAGNDYFELARFAGEAPSVVKPLVGGFVKRCTPETLAQDRESLRWRPLMVQRLIAGRALRSFVVGGRLVGTCETVYADQDVDSRHNVLAMRAFELGTEDARLPVAACDALGMLFAGVDMILEEASKRLYVLECNPAPFFRNFEVQTGLALSRELARYLVEEAAL